MYLYHTNEQNISDSQVISQIEALNRDFSAANTDLDQVPEVWQGLITDSGIRFALATKDPDGTPSSGINRIKTDWKSFPIEMFSDNPEPVKSSAAGGADAWPSDKCLNIWVCGLQGLVMGYAQFPGGPPETDGVVMSNWCFGTVGTVKPPFHLGRSTVHEIAHWLNLHDIWGYGLDCTGGDRVDDTPIQAEANFGKPAYPHISCDNGPHGDMYMNYMDQVDDDSMFLLHAGSSGADARLLGCGRKSFVHP